MSKPSRAAKSYFVSGRVQGVGFRTYTQSSALKLGLVGWVRNLPDGRVEAFAVGALSAHSSFERALRKGPPTSTVVSVEVNESVPGEEKGFAIRRDE